MAGKKLHYAWVTVAVGCLVIFSCIGLGRFSYGMILPSMQKGLGLGYSLMGYVGTGNFCGYLTGVALAPLVMKRLGARKTAVLGLGLIVSTMALVALSGGFWHLILSYFATGVGSGLANIPVMVVVGRWFDRTLRGKATGIMLAGNSFAIVFAGFFVPAVNSWFGEAGWRMAWGSIAVIISVVAVITALLLREDPSSMGLSPLGGRAKAGFGAKPAAEAPESGLRKTLLRLSGLYFTFGLTHVIYVTFFVTSLVAERGLTEASAGRFWAWVGLFGFLSGPLFGGLSDRLGRMWGMAAVFAVQSLSYLLAAVGQGDAALFGSIIFFGVSAWASPTIIASAVADSFPVERAPAAFSFVTFCLGLGQIIGPAIAGNTAEGVGGFGPVFLATFFVTALAAFVSAWFGWSGEGAARRQSLST